MTKSYKDPEFMMGPDARALRIMAEYIEPHVRLAREGVNRGLIFFGSARLRSAQGKPPSEAVNYYEPARELAARVARWTTETHAQTDRYFICTGGGPGIMEAANRGTADINPRLSLGYNISLPHEQGVNRYVSPRLSFEFHYFFMRKFWFMNLAHGLVIFPGGFGTMDELFEVLTLIQTGKAPRIPVVLYGRAFWERLIDFDLFLEMGLISPEDRELVHLVDGVEDAFEYLRATLEGEATW